MTELVEIAEARKHRKLGEQRRAGGPELAGARVGKSDEFIGQRHADLHDTMVTPMGIPEYSS